MHATAELPADGIARLSTAECSYAYFRAAHLLPNTPCLFPASYTQHWPIRQRIQVEGTVELDYDDLERRFGDLPVQCVSCGDAGTSQQLVKVVENFRDLLRLWRRGEGRSGYLKDWHLPLAVHRQGEGMAASPGVGVEEGASRASERKRKGKERVREELYEVPAAWLDDWMNEYEGSEREDDFRFVYAGGGETFTPLHRDVYCSYSISTQLFGRKRWYLFPPSCTADLRPLSQRAEREEKSVNCDEWEQGVRDEFRARGMRVVEQEVGESIFIPSGWYHSVHNLTHPTLSLNHNWANAHNLPAIFASLAEEARRCREAIEDVREMLVEQAARKAAGPGHGDKGGGEEEGGWRREWEETVNRLVEQSEGWSWPTFWRMTRHALSNLALPPGELERRAEESRWPAVPPEVRPPVEFVVQQVRPLLDDFRQRDEAEWRWLPGLEAVLSDVEHELQRLQHART